MALRKDEDVPEDEREAADAEAAVEMTDDELLGEATLAKLQSGDYGDEGKGEEAPADKKPAEKPSEPEKEAEEPVEEQPTEEPEEAAGELKEEDTEEDKGEDEVADEASDEDKS